LLCTLPHLTRRIPKYAQLRDRERVNKCMQGKQRESEPNAGETERE